MPVRVGEPEKLGRQSTRISAKMLPRALRQVLQSAIHPFRTQGGFDAHGPAEAPPLRGRRCSLSPCVSRVPEPLLVRTNIRSTSSRPGRIHSGPPTQLHLGFDLRDRRPKAHAGFTEEANFYGEPAPYLKASGHASNEGIPMGKTRSKSVRCRQTTSGGASMSTERRNLLTRRSPSAIRSKGY